MSKSNKTYLIAGIIVVIVGLVAIGVYRIVQRVSHEVEKLTEEMESFTTEKKAEMLDQLAGTWTDNKQTWMFLGDSIMVRGNDSLKMELMPNVIITGSENHPEFFTVIEMNPNSLVFQQTKMPKSASEVFDGSMEQTLITLTRAVADSTATDSIQ